MSSKIVNILTKEQVEIIQEVAETLNAAAVDERKTYQTWITDKNGTSTYFVNRKQFLEDTIEWCLNQLGSTFEFLE